MANNKATNIRPYPIYPTTAVTSGNKTSAVTSIFNQDNVGLQLIWTGTLAGTFDVQVSADYNRDTLAGTWTSVGLPAVQTAAGSASNAYVDLNQLSAPWVRVVFTYTSGSGNLTEYLVAKGV